MAESSASDGDKQRIAELESEVSRLRAQLEQPAETAGEDHPTPGDAREGRAAVASQGEDVKQLTGVTRAKAIVIAAIVLVVAVGLLVTVFGALSKGFDALSRKAARTLVGHEDEQAPPPREAPPPDRRGGQKKSDKKPPINVPGL